MNWGRKRCQLSSCNKAKELPKAHDYPAGSYLGPATDGHTRIMINARRLFLSPRAMPAMSDPETVRSPATRVSAGAGRYAFMVGGSVLASTLFQRLPIEDMRYEQCQGACLSLILVQRLSEVPAPGGNPASHALPVCQYALGPHPPSVAHALTDALDLLGRKAHGTGGNENEYHYM